MNRGAAMPSDANAAWDRKDRATLRTRPRSPGVATKAMKSPFQKSAWGSVERAFPSGSHNDGQVQRHNSFFLHLHSMPPIAVIDFETTGISPGQGARATEVAIVLLEQGQVVDRFQSLMKTGVWIPSFITQLTGITNAMVNAAPDAAGVMQDAARFVGDAPMGAHNASFDSKFWQGAPGAGRCRDGRCAAGAHAARPAHALEGGGAQLHAAANAAALRQTQGGGAAGAACGGMMGRGPRTNLLSNL